MEATERKAIRIQLGIETAFECYLAFNANQSRDYFRENVNTTIKVKIDELDRFGRTDELPSVLVVNASSASRLGEMLTNLHGIGYRLVGGMIVDRNYNTVRYLQIVEMKPVE